MNMAKVTWRFASEDSPIFSGGFVTSSPKSNRVSRQSNKTYTTDTGRRENRIPIVPIKEVLPARST